MTSSGECGYGRVRLRASAATGRVRATPSVNRRPRLVPVGLSFHNTSRRGSGGDRRRRPLRRTWALAERESKRKRENRVPSLNRPQHTTRGLVREDAQFGFHSRPASDGQRSVGLDTIAIRRTISHANLMISSVGGGVGSEDRIPLFLKSHEPRDRRATASCAQACEMSRSRIARSSSVFDLRSAAASSCCWATFASIRLAGTALLVSTETTSSTTWTKPPSK